MEPLHRILKERNETNFYNIDAIGGGDKRLDAVDANVYGILTMSNTDVDINTQALTLENSAPGALSYLNGGLITETAPSAAPNGIGELEWNIGNTVVSISTTYTVPFKTVGGTSIPFTYKVVDDGNNFWRAKYV